MASKNLVERYRFVTERCACMALEEEVTRLMKMDLDDGKVDSS
jgi:hypothetical protein